MAFPVHDLVIGQPRFGDATLAAIEKQEGAATAWRRALAVQAPEGLLTSARGEFAVFIRDRTRGDLAAVDRFAVHSLCYRADDDGLAVSTRADDLVNGPGSIDPQAILDYLYFHVIPSPRTIYRGVYRVPPGHFVRSAGPKTEVTRYWKPRFEESEAPFDVKRARFLDLLGQAVERRLDGSKAACFLSGGTDSSTIAGMIRRVTGQPPATYSIGFEADGYDEMHYARIAARHFGTEHHEHYITADDLVRLIPEVARHQDQPFGNSSVLPAHFCAIRAREDGVRHLLAGDGGDELFGGNSRYATQRILSWYDAVPGDLRRTLIEPWATSRAAAGLPLLRKFSSYVSQARVPMPARMQTHNLLHRLGPDEVLDDDFLAQVRVDDPSRHEYEVWQESAGASHLNRMLAFDWRYTLAENDLPKVRSATELAGIGTSYPFLDTDMVEFSESLADSDKLRGLKLRWFFKEALRGFLPEEIISKKKHGFGLPFGVWALKHEGLAALSTDAVRSLAGRGIVKAKFAESLVSQYLPQHPSYFGSMVWILMMLEQWFRHHAPNYRLAK